MKTVHEVSELTGVSVRTLHHYDAIGLLKPSKITEAGYRLYDDTAILRLQTILLFRELEFPLKEIKLIIDSPNFDRRAALRQQVELLELRKKRICEIISLACEIITTGVDTMNFSAFNKTEIENFTAEAKEKWGGTKAFKEYEQRAADQTRDNPKLIADKLIRIFADMGKIKDLAPECSEAQSEVRRLQKFITEHYYNCTPQILEGLSKMYVEDERFKTNIDEAGGAGTADFACRAINFYCRNCEN